MSTIDFNRSPWYDDFDKDKNYYKILFQPGRPVQARELNQVQTTLQHQVTSFANNIFKDGSIVANGRVSIQAKAYVRLADAPAVSSYVANSKLVGATSGITAILWKGVDAEGTDPSTLYVVYTGTAIDGETSTFIPGEVIDIVDENDVTIGSVTVICPTCAGSSDTSGIPATGYGQFFTVEEGVYYYSGYFIDVQSQDLIIMKYMIKDNTGAITNFVPCKLGFDFVQSIVTYSDDNTLLDNALGYPNSTAPGADRYSAKLVLVKRTYSDEDGENFILLAKLGEGMVPEFLKTDSEYATIMDTMAQRTYETNGNFTINPFKLSFLNELKTSASDSLGWAYDGDDNNLIALVTPATAYVKGYRVKTISNTPVSFPKARDLNSLSSFIKHFDERTYILAKPMGQGIWPNTANTSGPMTSDLIQIYDAVVTGSAVAGNLIGTMKVSDAEYVSGLTSDHTAIYKYYVYDISMIAGKSIADAKSYAYPSSKFYANAVPDSSSASIEFYSANKTALIYALDRDNVSSLRSIDDPTNGSMSIVVRRVLNGVADGSGSVTFTTSSNEYFNDLGEDTIAWTSQSGTITGFRPVAGSNVTFSPTTMTVNLGSSFAGATVYIIINILKTNQAERTKTPTNLTLNTTSAPSTTIGTTIALGKTDAYRLKSVKLYVDGSPSTIVKDLTSEYTLYKNDSDTAYNESYIKRTSAASFTQDPSYRLAINFDYLEHSGSQGFFTIDSYAPAINDSSSGLTYTNLGTYTDKAGNVYALASSIDFRPDVIGSTAITSVLPSNDSTAIFDIQYYLARYDLLQINKNGALYVKKGQPSDSPRVPKEDENSMALYEIRLKPYTYSLDDISTVYIDNRRYTMKDIGALETRIENLEYYTTLSLLEQSAANMSIKDANGLDRFKNGLIADNFSDFQAADLTNKEFKAAADRTKSQLRPQFKSDNRKLKFNPAKSSGFKQVGNMAMLPYTEEVYITQPYATKFVSINPYLQYNQLGTMSLSPNNDTWTSTTARPQVVINAEAGVDNLQDVKDTTQVLATDFGTHVDQNVTIVQPATTTTKNAATGTSNKTTGGIGGCVEIWGILDDGRFVGDIRVGDYINAIDPLTWTTKKVLVSYAELKKVPGVAVITSTDRILRCSTTAPLCDENGEQILAPETLNKYIVIFDEFGNKKKEKVVAIEDIGEIKVNHIYAEDSYFLANSIINNGFFLHHNMKMAPTSRQI